MGCRRSLAELANTWTPYRYAYDNPLRYIDPKGLFESRKNARIYREENNLNGRIKRNEDGSYSIVDKKNNVLTPEEIIHNIILQILMIMMEL